VRSTHHNVECAPRPDTRQGTGM